MLSTGTAPRPGGIYSAQILLGAPQTVVRPMGPALLGAEPLGLRL